MRKQVGSFIRQTFDRRGRRWVLSSAASLYSLYSRRGWTTIYTQDGLWVHHCPDGYIVERYVNFSATLALYETKTIRDWCVFYQPSEGDVIIDVGAGIGTEATYFSRGLGKSGLLLSIEAHPKTFEALSLFCQLNRLENVQCVRTAIHDSESDVLIDNPSSHVGSSIVGSSTGILVPGATLDRLVREYNLERIDFIKMNIEGAEKAALNGMRETLSITRQVCISCHDFKADRTGNEAFRSKAYVESYLIDSGFELQVREPDPRPWIRDQVNARNTKWHRA
ncbi:MAG: FkbM family methyltransferase [Anaerolineae bacterium]|nr:FkbM family methyltransferase [Anaerolineae bacterium]